MCATKTISTWRQSSISKKYIATKHLKRQRTSTAIVTFGLVLLGGFFSNSFYFEKFYRSKLSAFNVVSAYICGFNWTTPYKRRKRVNTGK